MEHQMESKSENDMEIVVISRLVGMITRIMSRDSLYMMV